ncbi:MAG: right-handed parallel beta-helix repeat-containing protein [Phycisphaerales bacterium]|jgi:hypothetical protein
MRLRILILFLFLCAGCSTNKVTPSAPFQARSTTLPHGLHDYTVGEPLRYYNSDQWILDNTVGNASDAVTEITAARGTESTLDDRLSESLNDDGTIKEAAAAAYMNEWNLEDAEITYVSTTQFKVAGDVTDIYIPQRKLKCHIATGDVYTRVSSSAYSASETTVTVPAAVLADTLDAVRYSIVAKRSYGSAAAQLKSLTGDSIPYYPQAYDAIVSTDNSGDYTSIKSSFDAGATTVYAMNGTYDITAMITLPANGVLIGESRTGVILDCDSIASGPAIECGESCDIRSLTVKRDVGDEIGINANNVDYVRIADVSVDNFDTGIKFVDCNNYEVRSCVISSMNSGDANGVQGSSSDNGIIRDCFFSNNSDDLVIGVGCDNTLAIGNQPVNSLGIVNNSTSTFFVGIPDGTSLEYSSAGYMQLKSVVPNQIQYAADTTGMWRDNPLWFFGGDQEAPVMWEPDCWGITAYEEWVNVDLDLAHMGEEDLPDGELLVFLQIKPTNETHLYFRPYGSGWDLDACIQAIGDTTLVAPLARPEWVIMRTDSDHILQYWADAEGDGAIMCFYGGIPAVPQYIITPTPTPTPTLTPSPTPT